MKLAVIWQLWCFTVKSIEKENETFTYENLLIFAGMKYPIVRINTTSINGYYTQPGT